MKRLLKKPPPKLRLLKLLLKKALTLLLLAPTLPLLVLTLPLLAPTLLLLRLLTPLLLRPLTPRLLRLLTPLLLRLKKRSKSQPLGAMTETKRGGLPWGRPPFSLPVTCGWTSHARLSKGREAGRGVAQPGSAPALGAGCRRFESCLPDQSPYPVDVAIRRA